MRTKLARLEGEPRRTGGAREKERSDGEGGGGGRGEEESGTEDTVLAADRVVAGPSASFVGLAGGRRCGGAGMVH